MNTLIGVHVVGTSSTRVRYVPLLDGHSKQYHCGAWHYFVNFTVFSIFVIVTVNIVVSIVVLFYLTKRKCMQMQERI